MHLNNHLLLAFTTHGPTKKKTDHFSLTSVTATETSMEQPCQTSHDVQRRYHLLQNSKTTTTQILLLTFDLPLLIKQYVYINSSEKHSGSVQGLTGLQGLRELSFCVGQIRSLKVLGSYFVNDGCLCRTLSKIQEIVS